MLMGPMDEEFTSLFGALISECDLSLPFWLEAENHYGKSKQEGRQAEQDQGRAEVEVLPLKEEL